jgi:hypothetical protein
LLLNYEFSSGAVGGTTGKSAVLPRFCKIGRGGGSGGAPPYYGGLSWPVRARRAGGAAVQYMKIPSSEHVENMLCTQIVFCFCFDIQNNLCIQHVLNMF